MDEESEIAEVKNSLKTAEVKTRALWWNLIYGIERDLTYGAKLIRDVHFEGEALKDLRDYIHEHIIDEELTLHMAQDQEEMTYVLSHRNLDECIFFRVGEWKKKVEGVRIAFVERLSDRKLTTNYSSFPRKLLTNSTIEAMHTVFYAVFRLTNSCYPANCGVKKHKNFHSNLVAKHIAFRIYDELENLGQRDRLYVFDNKGGWFCPLYWISKGRESGTGEWCNKVGKAWWKIRVTTKLDHIGNPRAD